MNKIVDKLQTVFAELLVFSLFLLFTGYVALNILVFLPIFLNRTVSSQLSEVTSPDPNPTHRGGDRRDG